MISKPVECLEVWPHNATHVAEWCGGTVLFELDGVLGVRVGEHIAFLHDGICLGEDGKFYVVRRESGRYFVHDDGSYYVVRRENVYGKRPWTKEDIDGMDL